LLLASPLLLFTLVVFVMSLPLLVVVVPLTLVAAAAWSFVGPVRRNRGQRSVPVSEPHEEEGLGAPRRNILFKNDLVDKQAPHLLTVPELMRATFERYGSRPAMGTRKTVKTVEKEVTVMVDGEPVKKKHRVPWQTGYSFETFGQMAEQITAFGAGLVNATQTPLKFGDKISIFAGTRPEWQVTAQAAFEHGLVVVTVYPSLGPDALSYSLNQTEASHLVCQASLMETVVRTAGQLKDSLRCVIYLDDLSPTDVQKYQKALGREVIAWKDVMARGKDLVKNNPASARPRQSPTPEDVAVIMYTSGSTGVPKGVLMSHGNIVAAIAGITAIVPERICENDVYIAYLPLAHVLELTAEITVMAQGGCLGFSSPLTLRDDGVCDEQGHPAGDLTQLRPTIMASVPLILDRLRAGVQEQVAKGSPITRLLFKTAYALKKRASERGYKTPLLDRLVFSKVAARFGGRLRYLLSGGAPLSPETHEFINITVGAPVLQGYGLTESLCGGTITHPDDLARGNVGPPVACCQVLLRDVKEMGYTSLDKPKPRGEICIGGPNISLGYFKLDDQTKEAYFEKDGVRYFATGDIGQWEENGTLRIIDRRKDLVKLAHGEYIALGALEAKYAAAGTVDNICLVADSHQNAPVALIAVNHAKLKELASTQGLGGNDAHVDELVNDPRVEKAVLSQLNSISAAQRMEKWERVAAVRLYSHPWTPDSGLLTEAMKLKRHEIAKRFKDDIDALYKNVH